MAPPCFSDLGKDARDLLSKEYYIGHVNLKVKSKASTGLEFNMEGTSFNDAGNCAANFEAKHFLSEHGITLKEKWKTDNSLTSELALDDFGMKGLKLTGVASYTPHSGKRSANAKSAFKNDCMHLNNEVDWSHNGTILHSALVVAYEKYLAGAQVSYNPSLNKMTKNNFSLGYMKKGIAIHGNLADGNEFSGSVYQRTSPKTSLGISLGWSSRSNVSRIAVGSVHSLDENTCIRGKVNNQGQIGLGLTHRLRDGVSMSLGAMIDGKNLSSGPHKFGLGLDLTA